MKTPAKRKQPKIAAEKSVGEILILADGKILAHNISPLMACVLAELNPADAAMSQRALRKKL
jgi:hypothetical protein